MQPRLRKSSALPRIAAWIALSAACAGDGSSDPPAPEEIPGGPWQVVSRTESDVLLAPLPGRARGRADAGPGTHGSIPVMAWSADDRPRPDSAALLHLTLPGAAGDSVLLGRWAGRDRDVLFGVPGASPPLLDYPTADGARIMEAAGTLWLVGPGGAVSSLVADSTAGFHRRSLARLQREGEVILYWAAVPVPDPTGERVAFVTNREAVRGGGPGQSIWLVDLSTGAEAPLVAEPGESFRPEGWLGDDVVFTGSVPGIRLVHPATRRTRPLADGVLLDVARDASVLALAEAVPDSTRVRLVTAEGRARDLPLPPAGMLYIPQATFAPDARRLLVQASSPDGTVRRFGVLDRERHTLHWVLPPVPPTALDAWPAWLDARTLLFTAAGSGGTSWAVPVP